MYSKERGNSSFDSYWLYYIINDLWKHKWYLFDLKCFIYTFLLWGHRLSVPSSLGSMLSFISTFLIIWGMLISTLPLVFRLVNQARFGGMHTRDFGLIRLLSLASSFDSISLPTLIFASNNIICLHKLLQINYYHIYSKIIFWLLNCCTGWNEFCKLYYIAYLHIYIYSFVFKYEILLSRLADTIILYVQGLEG